MGDRGQVFIENHYGEGNTGVYLYTHGRATELIVYVRRALEKRVRWSDLCYLTRIIFDEMSRGSHSELGFGICGVEHGDIWRLIKIKKDKMIEVRKYEKLEFEGTFEQFLDVDKYKAMSRLV